MNDLISRQAAIDAPVKMVSEGLDWIPVYHLKDLPSAQPEQKCESCRYRKQHGAGGQKGERMSEMMNFPDTWEEYEKIYGFNDSEEIYTNNSRLIPSFRVKQWIDHKSKQETKRQAIKASDCISRQDVPDTNVGDMISRQEILRAFEEMCSCTDYGWDERDFRDLIKKMPSAEPEIIRCKDCKYYYNNNPENIPTANIICFQMHEEDFCSYAERRTDE